MKTRTDALLLAKRAIAEAKKYKKMFEDGLDHLEMALDIIQKQDTLILKYKSGEIWPEGLEDSLVSEIDAGVEEIKQPLTKYRSEGGRNSKRPQDEKLLQSAKDSISHFRNERKYENIDLSKTHTQKSLLSEMKKRGFNGSLGWVKKYWHTITKLS